MKHIQVRDAPACWYTGESSPRADVVSFARRSLPLLRIACFLASLAAAEDIFVEVVVVVESEVYARD